MTIDDKLYVAKQFSCNGEGVPIKLGEKLFVLKKIAPCDDEVNGMVDELKNTIQSEDADKDLVEVICEHAVLIYRSLFEGDKRAFSSPLELLKSLTFSQMEKIYRQYIAYDSCSNCNNCKKVG